MPPSWDEHQSALEEAHRLAASYLSELGSRAVGAAAGAAELRAALDGGMPDQGAPAREIVAELAAAAEPGLVASAGPRYFGFVIGGSLPAALAADWLAAAWDQDAGFHALSPAAAAVEDVAAKWLLELLGLPPRSAVGFVTGGQMANFACLAAARHRVLEQAGWDVEARGLQAAPRVSVLVGEHAHVTIFSALRMLGLGSETARTVPADEAGRMLPDQLLAALAECEGPTIVCAQAGEVNTGSFDPFEPIAAACAESGAWLHVDGAFGLWAGADPSRRELVHGVERADSWAVDAHKWLNVPYDSGIAIVADPTALEAAMRFAAAYLGRGADDARDPQALVPESSRRARGFAVYAALRSLGRAGVEELVARCCRWAALMAAELDAEPAAEVLNEVRLNQVLVGIEDGGGDPAKVVAAVVRRIQDDGTCWLGGTSWRGRPAFRVSFSNWSTTEEDVRESAAAIRAAIRALLAPAGDG